MSIEYKLDKVGNFSIRENDSTLSFDGTVEIKFWVETIQDKSANPVYQWVNAITLSVVQNHFNFTL